MLYLQTREYRKVPNELQEDLIGYKSDNCVSTVSVNYMCQLYRYCTYGLWVTTLLSHILAMLPRPKFILAHTHWMLCILGAVLGRPEVT